MFCNNSNKKNPDVIRSREIDRELQHDNKKNEQYKQLLLLGTGESGKSTIIKQMKILHINGFSEQEKREKIPYIKQNLHESIYTIVYNMDKITPPIKYENSSNIAASEFILNLGFYTPEEFSTKYFNTVKQLWADAGVKSAFKRSYEYQLIDSAEYFLDRIDELMNPDYLPTIQDILYCRVTTTSISKIEFEFKKAKFWMYDVGGQRGYRKRWISVFEGIHSILFLIATSDFDLRLREDESENRLVESFNLLADMFWSRFLRTAGMIVFLNKQDLLERKIENGQRLGDYFPAYNSFKKNMALNEFENVKCFMKQKIIDVKENINMDENNKKQDREIYTHFTTATNTNNIKLVFNTVHDIIIKATLGTIPLL